MNLNKDNYIQNYVKENSETTLDEILEEYNILEK